MKRLIRKAINVFGYDLIRHQPSSTSGYPADITTSEIEILKRVAPYTMTSIERQVALIQAVRYIVRNGVPGCIVECGVWRGGSAMAAALALMQEGDASRNLYLFDTYEGMTAPQDIDRNAEGNLASASLAQDRRKDGPFWCVADIDDVRENLGSIGYPLECIKLVKGPVEVTIPANSPPEQIALLRLDTDWYESTKHELVHLFPLVSAGGIVIIDDYGYWQGSRAAVDEFLANSPKKYFLHRIDFTGRMLVKQ